MPPPSVKAISLPAPEPKLVMPKRKVSVVLRKEETRIRTGFRSCLR